MKLTWYMAVTGGNNANEYEQFESDMDAVDGFLSRSEYTEIPVLEICRCDDDECLTPCECIWY